MPERNFEVAAIQEDQAGDWFCQSNIFGGHIEADILAEFLRELCEHAAI